MSDKNIKTTRKRRKSNKPLKQYLSNETITNILESRFKKNMKEKDISIQFDITLTLTRNILKKYGDEYIKENNLNDDLPELDTLKNYWERNNKNKISKPTLDKEDIDSE